MARFYVGQPVRSIRSPEWWNEPGHMWWSLENILKYDGTYSPKPGLEWVITAYVSPTTVRVNHVPLDGGYWLHEDGFEPLTKKTVEELLRVDAPVDARGKERVDA